MKVLDANPEASAIRHILSDIEAITTAAWAPFIAGLRSARPHTKAQLLTSMCRMANLYGQHERRLPPPRGPESIPLFWMWDFREVFGTLEDGVLEGLSNVGVQPAHVVGVLQKQWQSEEPLERKVQACQEALEEVSKQGRPLKKDMVRLGFASLSPSVRFDSLLRSQNLLGAGKAQARQQAGCVAGARARVGADL